MTTFRAPSPPCQPTELFPICENGGWGYIGRTGRVAIPPRYARAQPCTEGLAAVAVELPTSLFARLRRTPPALVWTFVDAQGEPAFDASFSEVACYSEGLAPARSRDNGQWGYIDTTGRWILQPRYGDAREFAEGLAPLFVSRTGMWGYMNRSEKFVILPKFNAAAPFREGLAAVSYGPREPGARGTFGYIDTAGEWVIRPLYDDAGAFGSGLAPALPGPRDEDFADRAGRWGYIDREGRWVVEPRYTHAQPFSEGLAFVGTGGGVGPVRYEAIRPDGSVAFTVDGGVPCGFSGGLAAVYGDSPPHVPVAYLDLQGGTVWSLPRR